MQVGRSPTLDYRCLTRNSFSRKVCPQWFPLCEWGRVSTWRTERLSQGNTRGCPGHHRTLGKGLYQVSCLLVEWPGRNGEEHHCQDDRGEVFCRRTTWGLLLLFEGFRGPKKPSTHIPDTGYSTRAQVYRISIVPRPIDPVGPSNRLRITVQSDGQVDRSTPQSIQHFNCYRHRRFRRMCRRRTSFGDPVRPWAVCTRDPESQVLPHRSPGTTYLWRFSPPADGKHNGRVCSS